MTTVDLQASIDRQYISELENRCAMLARRCAEQARYIADLLATNKTPDDPDPIHAAIAVHQRAGQR